MRPGVAEASHRPDEQEPKALAFVLCFAAAVSGDVDDRALGVEGAMHQWHAGFGQAGLRLDLQLHSLEGCQYSLAVVAVCEQRTRRPRHNGMHPGDLYPPVSRRGPSRNRFDFDRHALGRSR